jgi:hypothetical protein
MRFNVNRMINTIKAFRITYDNFKDNLRYNFSAFINLIAKVFHPSNGSTAQIGPWPPLLRFLNHAQLDTRYDSSGRVISPSQRPLPTQDNTTYKHKRQTSVSRAEFEPAIPATKRPQNYALDRAATGIGIAKLLFIWKSGRRLPSDGDVVHLQNASVHS